jgi:hypothetical protein
VRFCSRHSRRTPARTRELIFVDNPAELLGFPKI